MSQKIHFLDELNPNKESWKIVVRILRLWTIEYLYPPSGVKSMELLLLDEQGDKIQASIDKAFIDKWKAILVERNCYQFETFVIKNNSGDFRASHHRYKICFNQNTSFKNARAPIPSYDFEFTRFEDIIHNSSPERFLVDVIGVLKSYDPVKVYDIDGIKTKRLSMILEDSRNNELKCTLWEEYAEQVSDYVKKFPKPGVTVVVFHLARLRQFQGNIYLTNSMDATMLLLNPKIPEVQEFRKRLISEGDVSSQPQSQISAQISHSNEIKKLQKDGTSCSYGNQKDISSASSSKTTPAKYHNDLTKQFNNLSLKKKIHRETNQVGNTCMNCLHLSSVLFLLVFLLFFYMTC